MASNQGSRRNRRGHHHHCQCHHTNPGYPGGNFPPNSCGCNSNMFPNMPNTFPPNSCGCNSHMCPNMPNTFPSQGQCSCGGYAPQPNYPLPNAPSYPPFGPPPDQGLQWVDSSLGQMHYAGFHGGNDIDGQGIFVGRAYHQGDLIPAKVIPGRNCAYVPYNGKEYPVSNFQVLSHNHRLSWIPDQGGRIPPGAVQGGRTATGETLYIGRVNHQGSRTVGKVHPSHRTCYIPFDGKEIGFPHYEVLVFR